MEQEEGSWDWDNQRDSKIMNTDLTGKIEGVQMVEKVKPLNCLKVQSDGDQIKSNIGPQYQLTKIAHDANIWEESKETFIRVDGHHFTDKELLLLIWLSAQDEIFDFWTFLLVTFYHALSFAFTSWLAFPLVYVIEGFNSNLLWNMQFFGCHLVPILFSIIAQVPSIFIWLFVWQWNTAAQNDEDIIPINMWDQCHFIIILVIRSLIIGVKYGTFSLETMQTMRKTKLPLSIINELLIFKVINEKLPNFVEDEFNKACSKFELEENAFQIQVYQDQQQFKIKDSVNLIQRLQDKELLMKYHADNLKPGNKQEIVIENDVYERPERGEDLMWRFEQVYGSVYEYKQKFHLQKLQYIMMTQKNVDINAKNLAIEIIIKNTISPEYFQYLFFSVLQFAIPFMVSYYLDEETFVNSYHRSIFLCQLVPLFVLFFVNLMLGNTLTQIVNQRKKYMESLLMMLDSDLRSYYKPKQDLPQINIHNPKNLNQIINLSEVLMIYNQSSYHRASIFCQWTVVIYSVPFFYICLEIIVRKKAITEVGSTLFVAFTFYDFFISLWYLIKMLYYGSQANQTFHSIKEILAKLAKDTIESKELCDDGLVFNKKPDGKSDEIKDIYILRKKGDKWISHDTGQTFDNLDDFTDINDRVEHQVQDLATALESAVGRIDHKIEYNQLSFFGRQMNMEFVMEIFFVVFSIVVGLSQQIADE